MFNGALPYDLVVIGAGINGAGIARDASLRGLTTCLIEQNDLASATSRWSSRLIHGGLRYLEHGELGLVYESLRERELLLTVAPHLVTPLGMLIPIYPHSRRGLAAVDFGLWLYDMLSLGRQLPAHHRLTCEAALHHAPGLNPEGLMGAALYYDAQVSYPERLIVENALSAASSGCHIRTYERVEKILIDDATVRGVRVRHQMTGAVAEIPARLVINAAGPWVDRVLSSAGASIPRVLGPTKGTHIVVARWSDAPTVACYAEARSDGRPFFIIPWNQMILIGTTDIRYDGDPGQVEAENFEVDYLLREAAQLFPAAGLSRSSVLYRYTGVRPLPRAGARDPGSVTRRHLLRHHNRIARGLYSVIGGKLTTYRRLAQDVVDQCVARLGVSAGPCLTASQALPGASMSAGDVKRALEGFAAIESASRMHLYRLYGSRALEVAALTVQQPDLARPICPFSHAIGAEVVFAFKEERATTLADCLFRRSLVGLSCDIGLGALPAALAVAKHHLGWDIARLRAEETRCHQEIDALRLPGCTPKY